MELKLQVAIDRVPLDRALDIVGEVREIADIVEIGTSLTKDYGMESIRAIRQLLDGDNGPNNGASNGASNGSSNGSNNGPRPKILADIKTMDEGAYEFEAAYAAGADYATVMGAAARATVEACYRVAENRGRDILIDLLETTPEKIAALQGLKNAVFCIHLPKDGPASDIVAKVDEFWQAYPDIERIAVAGGITLDQIPLLAKLPIEICIVGSAVTGADDVRLAAEAFAAAML
ncbi:orotidine 5'-phosphate decarboxylase [Alicyclobacillus curvatus]|nr:orotidine 5'-phosphate decarboxylase [Alicyclobacillus curvatus]